MKKFYYVNAFKSDVVIDMNTGNEAPKGTVEDGKDFKFFQELMCGAIGTSSKETAMAYVAKYEKLGDRFRTEIEIQDARN
jgi:hypothetical protein|tara:strand:+ start:1962 stop:2201 length:240 start_codon:yes stop_codon:yes gene_type:complete